MVGERLGAYTLEEDLGIGALGPVFAASDARNERAVVVRLLEPRFADDDDFWRSAQDLAGRFRRLHHPSMATVIEAVETGGKRALVEERVVGHSLGQELDARGGALPMSRAYTLFRQLCGAMALAHSRGLTHLRLNPLNVLIERREGRDIARVCGFCTGMLLHGEGGGGSTANDVPVHLAYYISPDEVHKGMETSARSDVYALGVMLYEAATGFVPFGGDDLYTVVKGHLMEQPPPPSTLVEGLPWYLEAVILRALAKHPDDRYPHALELGLYLEACRTGAVIQGAAPAAGIRVRRTESPAPEASEAPEAEAEGADHDDGEATGLIQPSPEFLAAVEAADAEDRAGAEGATSATDPITPAVAAAPAQADAEPEPEAAVAAGAGAEAAAEDDGGDEDATDPGIARFSEEARKAPSVAGLPPGVPNPSYLGLLTPPDGGAKAEAAKPEPARERTASVMIIGANAIGE